MSGLIEGGPVLGKDVCTGRLGLAAPPSRCMMTTNRLVCLVHTTAPWRHTLPCLSNRALEDDRMRLVIGQGRASCDQLGP